jgi:integrase
VKERRVVPGFRWDSKTGRAVFEVVVPGTNSRQRRRHSTFASSRTDALEKWKTFRDSVLSGSWDRKDLTLAAYVARYASTMGARVSKRTSQMEADVLRIRVLPFLGHVPLAKINAAMVRDLVGQLKRDGYKVRGSNDRRPYSAAAINQALAILRKYLRDAVDRGELAAYPIRGKLPREREERLELEMKTEERLAFIASFNDEEGFRRDLDATRSRGRVVTSPHFAGPRSFGGGRRPEGKAVGYHFGRFQAAQIVFIVALECGLSRSDLLALEWHSIDLAGGWVRLARKKTGVESVIPISAACRTALEDARKRFPFSTLVFRTPEKQPYSVSTFLRYFDTAKRLAGITRRVRVHDLRHTFASRLASKGVSLQLIARSLGHTTARMSERYARPDEAAFRAVREALDAPQSELFRELSVASVGGARSANPFGINGAGDGDRTHDIQLGKLTFYH